MTSSDSMTNISSRSHVWWIQDVLGKAHLCRNTWLQAALVLRAQCETKNPILDTQTHTCAYPQSGNPQNKECMLIVATPRPRANPDVYPDFHMNWFMKLLWTHPFAHFKFEDIFLSHQRAQAQANPHPVTPEWQDPDGKSRYALLLLTLPVSASPLTHSWRALDFTQAREECSSAFLSQAVLLLFPISKCCIC